MEKLINVVFPPKCVFCGNVGDVFCENCISNCSILLNQRCILCDGFSEDGNTHDYCVKKFLSRGATGNRFIDRKFPSQFLSVFAYEKNVRECIRKSKYSSRLFMCLKRLSFEGVNIVYEWGYGFNDFIAVSIPVSKQKEKVRGFNQVDVISKVFAKRFEIPVDNSILSRTKDKKAQHALSRRERFENISGSFTSNEKVKDKKIVLIDDICTSGATFLEASRVLYESGAADVRCFALSKRL